MPATRHRLDGLGITKTIFLARPCLPVHNFLHGFGGSDLTASDSDQWFHSRIRLESSQTEITGSYGSNQDDGGRPHQLVLVPYHLRLTSHARKGTLPL